PLSAGVTEGQGPGGHLPRTRDTGAGGGHLGHVPGLQVRVGCDDDLGLLGECGPLDQGGGCQVVGLRLGGDRIGLDTLVVVVPVPDPQRVGGVVDGGGGGDRFDVVAVGVLGGGGLHHDPVTYLVERDGSGHVEHHAAVAFDPLRYRCGGG